MAQTEGRRTMRIPDEYLVDLRERLNNSAEGVCRHLLPGGMRVNKGWRCGGIDGSEGKSLEVELEGSKVGLFHDRATGEGGSILELWKLSRGLHFTEAVLEAAEFVGMSPPRQTDGVSRVIDPGNYTYTPPVATDASRADHELDEVPHAEEPSPVSTPPPAVDWDECLMAFTPEKAAEVAKARCYSIEFVNWLHEQEKIGLYNGAVAFPVHDSTGAVIRIHYRTKKGWAYHPKEVSGNGPLIVGEMPNSATHVLVFESQWDAFAVLDKLEVHKPHNMGIYSAFITRGATSNTDISKLPIPKIIACPQNDPEEKAGKTTGRTPAQEWLRRIASSIQGSATLRVAETPSQHKDANDWIRADKPGHYEVFTRFVEKPRPLELADTGSNVTQPPEKQPHPILGRQKLTFPVPAGGIGFIESAEIIFPVIGASKTMFMRGNIIHEIRRGNGEGDYLNPMTPERFCNLVEGYGHKVKRREVDEKKGLFIWRKTTFPLSSAKIMLTSQVAAAELPPIHQIAACPVLTPSGEVLGYGYHDHCGGTYVTGGAMPPTMPLAAAVNALLGLVADFNFVTPSDKARAVACIISPAMKMGGLISEDFPMDMAEADQSQSGKTYRQKLIVRIYNEVASAVISARGGVGSLDEAISAALIKGRPFITLDNFRGLLDSTILEQAIRGHRSVNCRALRISAEVETRPFIWQLSTNGAELTRDMANRSIITRIRKHEPGYNFTQYREGDLLEHVIANQAFYLGAIFTVISEWQKAGCPRTNDNRHAFTGWCQVMDWIVQNILGLAPLLDGHEAQQERAANPKLQWLRDVAMAARSADSLGRKITTAKIVEIADEAAIEFPGESRDSPAQRAGKILKKLFKDSKGQPISVDGYIISREVGSVYTPGRGEEDQKLYTFVDESAI